MNLDVHCARKGYQKFQEFKVVTRDGARKTIEMGLEILKDDDGKPLGIVAISRDVPDSQKKWTINALARTLRLSTN